VLRKAERELNWIPKAPYLSRLKETKFNPTILSKELERELLYRLPPHLQAIVKFALQTGLRKTAIVGLTHDMFNAETKILHIPPRLNKHGEGTKIPLTRKACQIIASQPLGGVYNQIFKYQGRPIKDPARSAWRKARRDCGLSDFRFHDLRHTWTSRGVKKGLTEAQLAYLGGWKSTRMVRHYTNLNDLKISDLPGYE
jgi:integrase